jgi:hypothetical protein
MKINIVGPNDEVFALFVRLAVTGLGCIWGSPSPVPVSAFPLIIPLGYVDLGHFVQHRSFRYGD